MKAKPRIVSYVVTFGVTSRHLCENAGVYDRLKDAKAVYDSLELKENYKAKRLTRLSFPDKWSGADNVQVLEEVIA